MIKNIFHAFILINGEYDYLSIIINIEAVIMTKMTVI